MMKPINQASRSRRIGELKTQSTILSLLRAGVIILIMSLSTVFTAHAAIEVYEFDTPQQEAQYKALIEEFRCPKCQNQNLAGSNSQIAQDLKRKTYQMVMDGQSDAQIRDYMQERYGDFISYKPPIRPSTWILWYFPPVFLVCLVGWWLWRSKSKTSLKSTAGNMDTIGSTQDRQRSTTDDDHDTNAEHIAHATHTKKAEDIKSDLSSDEEQQLKSLLDKYNANDEHVSKDIK